MHELSKYSQSLDLQHRKMLDSLPIYGKIVLLALLAYNKKETWSCVQVRWYKLLITSSFVQVELCHKCACT